MEWQQEQRFDYVAQYVPNISEPNEQQRVLSNSHPTQAQIELFALNPDDYNLVEQWLSKLPRQQQREHFRNIYIREYKSVKDDGTIAFKVGNKQRKHANEAIREILLRRLDLVMAQYHFDLSWLDMPEATLSRREEELADSDDLTDKQSKQFEQREKELDEQEKQQNADNDYIAKQRAGIKAAKQAIKKQKTIQRSANRINAAIESKRNVTTRMEERQKLPFFMLPQSRLESIADALATMIASYQYDFVLQYAHLKAELSKQDKTQIFLDLYQKCGEWLESVGFPIAYWDTFRCKGELKGERVDKALADSSSAKYWLKRFRKEQKRQLEHIEIASGSVQKKVAAYISNRAYGEWHIGEQKKFDFLKAMILECEDTGEQVELIDMWLRSNACPTLRRIEMTTRMNGIEEWADSVNAVGLFVTLTAPSAYHAQLESGAQNKKWNGASPRTTHQYLNTVWAQYRALLAKRNITFYGLRVAEPHHDATPHWHLLLFVSAEHKETVIELFRRKALEQDGDERGAKLHRLKVDEIDKARGTATGYIIKYLNKNIDGFAQKNEMSDEVDNLDLRNNAKRARAWASLWGIRQFQFYGASSIGVWRELRRLVRELENPKMEELRLCADLGDQAAFLQRQGGAGAKREDWQLVLAYEDSDPNDNGQTYKKIVGIKENPKKTSNPEVVYTRTKKWKARKKNAVEIEQAKAADLYVGKNGGLARPWTCVSNCNRLKIEQLLECELKKLIPNVTESHIDYLLNDNRLWIDRFKYIEVRNGRLLMNDRSNLLQKHSGLSRLRSH